jgi:S1-C subfamily serine protease
MWFVRSGSRVTGPFTEDQLRAMRRRGEFAATNQISLDRIRWDSAAQLVVALDGSLPQWRERKAPDPEASSQTLPMVVEWYYVGADRQQQGPVPERTLCELLQAKKLRRSTLACRAGESRWDRIDRYAEFAPFLPSQTRMVLAIAGTAVLCIGALATILFVKRPKEDTVAVSTTPGEPQTGSGSKTNVDANIITSLDDQKRIDQTVGFVVCGWSVRRKDGDVEEEGLTSGSCFAISPDGYLLTNKHVIDFILPRKRMQPEFRIADYSDSRIRPYLKAVAELRAKNESINEANLKAILQYYDKSSYQSVDAKIWVFFGNKDEKYDADVVHVSSFDMAILKVDRKQSPYARLADVNDLPKLRSDVYALGFPGAARKGVSNDENFLRELQRKKNIERIQDQFLPSDFGLSSTAGKVSRIVNETQNGQRIQHDADIKHGNSGGPLVTSNALVVGINTWGTQGDQDSSGVYYALALPQLRTEISRAIEQYRGPGSR